MSTDNKNGTSEPHTAINKKEVGRICFSQVFSLPSASCVYGWVSGTIFLWWTVGKLNWQCRQAGRPGQQAVDVCGLLEPFGGRGSNPSQVQHLGVRSLLQDGKETTT